MATITNLDDWLRQLTDGLPPVPKQYEFRCHPDVFLAIRKAADAENRYVPDGAHMYGSPLFGSADVRVQTELGPGGWELYADGALLKAGRLVSPPPSGQMRGCAGIPVAAGDEGSREA